MPYTKPEIWRRVHVDPRLTMEQLHKVIQLSFGWQDCHLHMFIEKGGNTYAHPRALQDSPVIDERKAQLSSVFTTKDKKVAYEYDFGDSWLHQIDFEDIIDSSTFEYHFAAWSRNDNGSSKPRAAICIAGERSAPPEDCGGIPGFENILALKAKPANARLNSDDHDILKWLGNWEPDKFHLAIANLDLPRIRVKKAFL